MPIFRRVTIWVLLLLGLPAPVWIQLPAAATTPTERLVTIGGSVTEIVFEVGGGDAVVGVDTSSVFPQATTALPKVGYARALSAEGILSLAPTKVIASGDAGPPPVLQQLRDAGVDLTIIPDEPTVAGARSKIEAVARALGRQDEGRRLIQILDTDLAEAELIADASSRRRVLFIYARGAGTLSVAGGNTSADAMIRLAGAQNAISEFDGFKPLTAEGAVSAKPEVLLMLTRGVSSLGGEAEVASLPGIALTPAGKTNRLVVMDDLYLLGFGPRTGKAAKDLAQRLRDLGPIEP